MYTTHGTTLAGLVAEGHTVSFPPYSAAIHSRVDYEGHLQPSPPLRRLLLSIPGRLIAFTNGFRVHAERAIGRLGVADLFERIISVEDMNPAEGRGGGGILCKPAAGAFLLALRLLGLGGRVSAAAVVDDSRSNARAAKELGIYSVLTGSAATGADASDADACLDSILDLREGAAPLWEVAPTRVIIDTDPGVDDMMALLLALTAPELQVEGITIVGGNHYGARCTLVFPTFLPAFSEKKPCFPSPHPPPPCNCCFAPHLLAYFTLQPGIAYLLRYCYMPHDQWG